MVGEEVEVVNDVELAKQVTVLAGIVELEEATATKCGKGPGIEKQG